MRYWVVLFASLNFRLFTADFNPLPDPYDQLTTLLPFDGTGWYINERQIERIMRERSVHVAVEVGSWIGLSTRHIASLLQPGGKLYAVDHWLGSEEHQPGAEHYARPLEPLYDQFLSNVIHAHLTDRIVPVRMSSLDAAQVLMHIQPDLIYLDAGHDWQSVYNDLSAWFPYVLRTGGILCGDDWQWESTRLAVTEFAKQRQLSVYVEENFWMLERN